MSLLGLPTDLLIQLPYYLEGIDDLRALSHTCSIFHVICDDPKVKTRPACYLSSPYRRALQPWPELLIAGLGRQLGDWAIESVENRNRLHAAFMRGLDGLEGLAVEVGKVSVQDMRALCKLRFEI